MSPPHFIQNLWYSPTSDQVPIKNIMSNTIWGILDLTWSLHFWNNSIPFIVQGRLKIKYTSKVSEWVKQDIILGGYSYCSTQTSCLLHARLPLITVSHITPWTTSRSLAFLPPFTCPLLTATIKEGIQHILEASCPESSCPESSSPESSCPGCSF